MVNTEIIVELSGIPEARLLHPTFHTQVGLGYAAPVIGLDATGLNLTDSYWQGLAEMKELLKKEKDF